ncbi:eukaryotic translation initiation factor 5 [Histoplasma capsulatum]|uniref:Eukaryotic translation initiation factor 5 n=1 Tax=Ajellomyces capsulatus TaxID=5037 RepID=A0A8A1MIT1_AJECA|nr:eukaryotic translation initiation factor 5 [Histoplasma capsulatum]
MATTVNIRRDNPDPFYRYKMERLQAKIEGKGNGIKTVVVNLNNVAQSLGRPPAYLIKYFGFELGAQANAKPTDDRWIINGAHDASKLQDYLDGFIVKFVLCKKCKNPETEVVVKEPRIILDCKACGERSDVDLRQKLSSFILKNQPKKGKKDKSTKKSRRERNKGKGDGETNGEANGDPKKSTTTTGRLMFPRKLSRLVLRNSPTMLNVLSSLMMMMMVKGKMGRPPLTIFSVAGL